MEKGYPQSDEFTDRQLELLPFYMKYRVQDKRFYMDFHAHRGYELYLLHEGQGTFLTEDRIYTTTGHDLILTESFEPHKSSPQSDSIRTVINFLPEMLDPATRETFLPMFSKTDNPNRHLRLDPQRHNSVFGHVQRLYAEYAERPEGYQLALRIGLNGLLLDIYRLLLEGSPAAEGRESRELINPKMQEVITYLSKNYMHSFSLDALAEQFYINPYYLCHLFKKTTGMTITDFVSYTRIHHAKRQLADTQLPISEIAGEVGFNSFSYFGQVFKSIEGVTPREYRKRHQSLPPSHKPEARL